MLTPGGYHQSELNKRYSDGVEGVGMEKSYTSGVRSVVAFFTELKFFKKNLICKETQKALNSQNNLEKEAGSWRNHAL